MNDQLTLGGMMLAVVATTLGLLWFAGVRASRAQAEQKLRPVRVERRQERGRRR